MTSTPVARGADELVERARTVHSARGPLPERVRGTRTVVVTCMDCRIMVEDVFALRLGEAYVIRNAGATVTDDVLRSLTVAQRLLGTSEILLIAHTDCGMSRVDDGALVERLREECGSAPAWSPAGFVDVREHVRAGLRRLASSPHLVPGSTACGFVYDVETGALEEVAP